MVSRKSFALAAALLLFTPLGVAGNPVERDTFVVAELANVEGVPMKEILSGPNPPPLAPGVTEGVVEGHTTFAVVNVPRETESLPDLGVVGFVSCEYTVFGITVPLNAVTDQFTPGCRPGDLVLITESHAPPPASHAELQETGWSTVVEAPDAREPVRVLEYRYRVEDTAPDGRPVPRWAYAWMTSVRPPAVNPHSGDVFNFVGAVNLERAWEQGVKGVTVYTADAWT